MRSTPARRELAFVLAVACAGLAVVLVVVFAPWYPATPPAAADLSTVRDHLAQLIADQAAGGATLTR
ncbi:hypothetical protein [Paractinoplanes globisporus]|jgi:hypothetical protein|uniref:Uncharacterized protein n=1 Tax=Paractinoplanes globisporus TaxID=113565 RepID=A0ABW6WKR3_9ACTN|nr:hypothetical protein [Actinoplanes globisporus]